MGDFESATIILAGGVTVVVSGPHVTDDEPDPFFMFSGHFGYVQGAEDRTLDEAQCWALAAVANGLRAALKDAEAKLRRVEGRGKRVSSIRELVTGMRSATRHCNRKSWDEDDAKRWAQERTAKSSAASENQEYVAVPCEDCSAWHVRLVRYHTAHSQRMDA